MSARRGTLYASAIPSWRLRKEYAPLLHAQAPTAQPKPGTRVASVAIVAACKGRHVALRKVVPSWLAVSGVTEVLLVDWASQPPLHELVNRRVRVVRVENEAGWVMTRAYNLAVAMANAQWVVRVDCDCKLKEGVLERHLGREGLTGYYNPTPSGFWGGHWERARDESEVHLSGVAIVRRADFLRVGGYDERIQTFGWEDQDLFARLEKSGLKRYALDYNQLEHVPHADELRMQSGVEFPEVNTDFNSLLLERLPEWRGAWTRRHLNGSSLVGNDITLPLSRYKRLHGRGLPSNRVCLEALDSPPSVVQLVDERERGAAWSLALGRRLHDTYELCWDFMTRLNTHDREYLVRRLEVGLVGGRAQKVHGRLMIVHVMHGLGNRLRALGSALGFARATGRVAVVVWEPDRHCRARFDDLFERRLLDGEDIIVMDGIAVSWPFNGAGMYDGMWEKWELYNYMVREGGRAKKDSEVYENCTKNVYFKAAYVMQTVPHKLGGWDSANAELRKLRAVKEVRAIVESAEERLGQSIGVHIRHLASRVDVENIDAKMEYGEADAQVIDYWRRVSKPESFAQGVRQVMEEKQNVERGGMVGGVFVAADDEQWVEAMQHELGDLVWSLRHVDGQVGCWNKSGEKRSAECLRGALADLLCLSKTRVVLGSMWSSFSEAVARLGGGELRLAGIDFGSDVEESVEEIGRKYGSSVAKVVDKVRDKRRERRRVAER